MIPLEPVHAAVIAAMHRQCFTAAWTERDMAETLAMPGAYGFLDGEDQARGFVLARAVAGEAEILSLAVLPPWRGRGCARALMASAITRALALGSGMMFLEVDAENFVAQALYEDLGFYTVGLRPRYYGETDALVLRKDIVPPAD